MNYLKFIKKYKVYFIIVLIIVCYYFFVTKIVYINSHTTCGKAIRYGETKGAIYTIFSFTVNKKSYSCTQSSTFFKDLPLDTLKKIDCIKIEYSTFLPVFNRVVDERILLK
jgi:hypothetical protein